MAEIHTQWGDLFDGKICTEVSWPESVADCIRCRGADRNGADSSRDGPDRPEDGKPAGNGPASGAELR
jgi:hypothetical protein